MGSKKLDHKEGWVLKNWCFQTVVLEKTLESPLNTKEVRPVHPKGNQPWILIGRTDAEAEALILQPPEMKSWLIGKDPDAGKDWGQEEKRVTEGEMVGWHHWLNGHEFEQTPGDSEGQGSLACCSPWGHKESDSPERLNNNRNNGCLGYGHCWMLCLSVEKTNLSHDIGPFPGYAHCLPGGRLISFYLFYHVQHWDTSLLEKIFFSGYKYAVFLCNVFVHTIIQVLTACHHHGILPRIASSQRIHFVTKEVEQVGSSSWNSLVFTI